MRSSEGCFENQTAGKVTEKGNSQRQLTFTPQHTHQGAQEGDSGPETPLPAHLYWFQPFHQSSEKQGPCVRCDAGANTLII